MQRLFHLLELRFLGSIFFENQRFKGLGGLVSADPFRAAILCEGVECT